MTKLLKKNKWFYLQSLNLFSELRHPLDHHLNLLQTLTETFDMLLDTYHPRLTIM